MNKDNHVYKLVVLEEVKDFIDSLPEKDRVKITSEVEALCNSYFGVLYIKTLRGKIKELIVGRYRIIFFIEICIIYLIRIFLKKTKKAPISEIEYAEKIYKIINKQ